MTEGDRRAARAETSGWFAGLVICTFLFGLPVDQYGGLAGQIGVSIWCWCLMLRLVLSMAPRSRTPFFVCLVWATVGEIFLSLIWGVYAYRLGNIPLFVPPGHVLLFWLGLGMAPRVTERFTQWVAGAVVVYAGYALYSGWDTISVLLACIFLACWLHSGGRRLYSVMLLLALLLELYGTWLGNWVWRAEVPVIGMTSRNPPLLAGAFYCVLDILVWLTGYALASRLRIWRLVRRS